MSDLPHRPRNASGPRRKSVRPQDHREDPLLHPASRHGARPVGAQGRRAREFFRILQLSCARGDWADDRRCRVTPARRYCGAPRRDDCVGGRDACRGGAGARRRAIGAGRRDPRDLAGGTRARRRRHARSRAFACWRCSARALAATQASTPAAKPVASSSTTAISSALDPAHPDTARRLRLGAMVARHLALFIGGKLEVAGLGEFCCSSRPLRQREATAQPAEIA